MNKTFTRTVVNGRKYNILALPNTNLFKYEQVNLWGSNVERVVNEMHGINVYGISHFIEHLGFRASKDYTTSELIKVLKSEGMHNASTSHDRINYWFKTTMDRMDVAINLVCNYALNDLKMIPPDEFDIEKKVVFNEAKRYMDDDQTMFYFNVNSTLSGYHAEDNILGLPEVIDTFTIDDAIYVKNIFLNCGETVHNITYDSQLENIDVIINKIETEIARFDFEKNDYADIVNDYTDMMKHPRTGTFESKSEATQAMTAIIFDVVSNVHTARVANAYLSQYAADTSLNDVIREQHGLTYGINFSDDQLSYKPYTVFSCDVSRGDEDLLMRLFKESINTSVDVFDETAYNALMKTLKLKRVMSYLDQQRYDMLHWLSIWDTYLVDEFSNELANDVTTVFDAFDSKYATYDKLKSYLVNVKDRMNNEFYGKVVN